MSKIFVLGMHRSGTSAVTGLLRLCGASLGADDPELVGADWSNPKGHWERRDVVRLNDKILAEHGFDWKSPGVVTETSYSEEIREILAKMGPEPWVIKDPRLSLTFDVWEREIDSAFLVYPFRSEHEVAESLRVRNSMPLEEGRNLNGLYRDAADVHAARCPTAWVPYGQLIRDPFVEAMRLFKRIQGLKMPAQEEIHDFIDPKISTL